MNNPEKHNRAIEQEDRYEYPIFDRRFKSNPHTFYNALRTERRGLAAIRLPTGVEGWLVIGFDEARKLLNDYRLSKDFRYAGRNWHLSHVTNQNGSSHPVFRHLLTLDPPKHTRMRAMVAYAFSPARMALMRPKIEALSENLVDCFADRASVDLIEDYAIEFPLRVICDLLGVPVSDRALFRRWSRLLVTADENEQHLIPVAGKELREYLLSLASDLPRSDNSVLAALTQRRDNGEISDEELAAMGFLILVAGHETTVNLIGSGTLMLLNRQGAWKELCRHPDLIGSAVEELLRFASPVEVATPRFAKEPILIDGVRIEPGDVVFIGLAAANRDCSKFVDPNQLMLDRAECRYDHLAFGYGIHYCLGASLARLDGEIAFSTLTRRFPDMSLGVEIDELEWRPGLIMRGLRHLPVNLY